jgi:hypothetical protein
MSNKYSIRYLNKNEFDLWDNFVEECETGSVFNKTYWLENIYKYKRATLRIIGCFNTNNDLVAGYAFGHKTKFNIFPIIVPPSLTPINNIVIKERDTRFNSKRESYHFRVFYQIIEFLEKYYKIISFTFPLNLIDVRPFLWKGYTEEIRYTYFSDISDLDDVFKNFDSAIVRRIKKTKDLPYKIDTSKDINNVETFYHLQELSFRKQRHLFMLTKVQFVDFLKVLLTKEKVKIYTVYLNKNPVASIIILFDKDIAYYWLAGSDPSYLITGVNQLLLWEVLKDIKKAGIRYFDFHGANTSTIARYKATFNFKLYPYFNLYKENGILIKLLMLLKTLLRP